LATRDRSVSRMPVRRGARHIGRVWPQPASTRRSWPAERRRAASTMAGATTATTHPSVAVESHWPTQRRPARTQPAGRAVLLGV